MSMKIRAMLVGMVVTALVVIAAPATAGAYSVPYGSEAIARGVWNETFAPESLEGGNKSSCKPSESHPYPVVLVHGTFEDEGSNWVTLAPLLVNNGYCVYAFNYGETVASFPLIPLITPGRIDGLGHIENSAKELASFVQEVLKKTKASKVDLVGHSQGGMMPDYYIDELYGDKYVNEMIGLAGDNHGTTVDGLTTLANTTPFVGEILGTAVSLLGAPSLPEQEVGSAFIKKVDASGTVAADPGEPIVGNVKYVEIESEHDEVVTPYTSAFVTGPKVTDILIQSQCPADPTGHVGIVEDSPALQNVLNQLSLSPVSGFKATCSKYGVGV